MPDSENTIVQHRLPSEGADYLLLAGVNDQNLQELARQTTPPVRPPLPANTETDGLRLSRVVHGGESQSGWMDTIRVLLAGRSRRKMFVAPHGSSAVSPDSTGADGSTPGSCAAAMAGRPARSAMRRKRVRTRAITESLRAE